MKNKKFLAALLAILTLCSTVPAYGMTITESRSYDGQFTDVSTDDWFYDDVVDAYSLGLLDGKSATTFAPAQGLTIAETIKLAAVCHQLLTKGSVNQNAFNLAGSGKWYEGYVAYCYQNGIVTEDYPDYNAGASRAQVAILFYRTIRSSGVTFKELNPAAFGDLPDVPSDRWYAGAVYSLYRFGILTGDANGNINPEAKIKRREIAAILMRMMDESKRQDLDAVDTGKTDTPAENDKPNETTGENKNPDVSSGVNSVTLYLGNRDKKSFTGITGVAAELSIEDGDVLVEAEYSLDLLQALTLEEDNISFRLYTGAGYEAMGIVRGWLNEAARGKDGAAIRDKADVYEKVNELLCLWINGKRVVISELWYADHGDYTTYAFYFKEDVDPGLAESVDLLIGRLDSEILESASLPDYNDWQNASDEGAVITPDEDDDTTEEENENYTAAISDAKDTADTILYEAETKRCYVLYGRGLYGRERDEYRLLFIYKDGTTQTIASQKLDNIRMNDEGNVLYYTLTAPDGKSLQYGINFGE